MKSFFKYLLASILGVLISGFIMIIILLGIFSAMISFSEKPEVVRDKSILILPLEEMIVERSEKNLYADLLFSEFSGSKKLGLDDILKAIERAKNDEKIRGIYLTPSIINAGYATTEEIRRALLDFKESGKFIYAYAENVSQKAYYLISAADSIMLNPQGAIEFVGIASQSMFFKDALEKLGVEIQVIRHGKFKAAVEPFTLNGMSEENRLQTKTYISSIWNKLLADISAQRRISVEELNRLADDLISLKKADVMKDAGLVDALKYKDEVLADLKRLTYIEEKDDLRAITVEKYLKSPVKTQGKGLARDKIAVIYASGEIDMNASGIDSEKLSQSIRKARRDSTIKAIVLRINSPGGSAYGSEIIWREVKLASDVKPVIASMGDMAASGGYYIAAAADTIIANHTTITGSIGVFGILPNAQKLLNDKLGITVDGVKTNAYSDMPSIDRRMTDFERASIQQFVENTYDTFLERVADGRKMTKVQVDELGQGRVWSGENGNNMGLTDLYGGVNDAVKMAAEICNLEHYRVVQLPEIEDPLEKFLKEIGAQAQMRIALKELGPHYKMFQTFKTITESRGIMARLPYYLEIN